MPYLFEPLFLISLFIFAITIQRYSKKEKFKKLSIIILVSISLFTVSRFLQMNSGTPYNYHDLYHYVIGGKYFNYLGYKYLYVATAQALEEHGFPLNDITVRDLSNKENGNDVHWRAKAETLKKTIPTEIWIEFKADIYFFSEKLNHSPQYWQTILNDYGFNPAPLWVLEAAPFLHALPLATLFPWLPFIDYSLLVLVSFLLASLAHTATHRCALFAVYWLIIVYYPAVTLQAYLFTISSFLRYSWFFFLASGSYFLIKQRYFTAGCFLTLAGLERLFPFAFVGVTGLILLIQLFPLKLQWNTFKQSAFFKFSLGILSSFCLIFVLYNSYYPLSHLIDFKNNMQTHNNLYAANNVGYKKVATFSGERIGYEFWYVDATDRETMTRNTDENDTVFYQTLSKRYNNNFSAKILQITCLMLVTVFALRFISLIQAIWLLSITLLFFFTLMSYYYQVFFALYAVILMYFSQEQPHAFKALLYLLGFCLSTATAVLFFNTILDISTFISVSLWFFLPLIASSYVLNHRQQLMVASGLSICFVIIVWQNLQTTNPNLSPYSQFYPFFAFNGVQLQQVMPSLKLIPRTYLDENANRIQETGAILRTGNVIEFNLTLNPFKEDENLVVLLRSDFNYPVSLALQANGTTIIQARKIPQFGSFWKYEPLLIPASALRTGENQIQIKLVEGKAFALFHVWCGYFKEN